jgi:Ca2+-binding RTX toxin-like protein
VRRLALAAGVLVVVCALPALTATNTVPASYASQTATAITANTLKPASCSGITLTAIVIGNDGTAANELVLDDGTGGLVRGRAGNDCVLGGGGDDDIRGNGGTDVCIGGPGNDIFNTCETQIP